MRRILFLSLALALTTAAFTSVASASVSARAAQNCSVPKYPGVGYFTGLSVSHVGCATGRKLMLSFYRCRIKHGKAGRCTSTVLGFRCSEHRIAIPTEIDSRVTCTKGSQKIVHTYQQDL